MNANTIVRHCSSTLHFVAALNFLIKNIAKVGDGFAILRLALACTEPP